MNYTVSEDNFDSHPVRVPMKTSDPGCVLDSFISPVPLCLLSESFSFWGGEGVDKSLIDIPFKEASLE